jgi:hypothetical protein
LLSGKTRAIQRKIREGGIVSALGLAMRKSADLLLKRDEILYYVDIPNYALPSSACSKNASIRKIDSPGQLTESDLDALRDYGGAEYIDEINSRLGRSWALFLADSDKEVAAGGWVLTHETEFVSKVVPLLGSDVSIIDCFTFHQFRGRNLYAFLLASVVEHYQREGCLRAFGYVRMTNVPSIRGLDKAGFCRSLVYQSARIGSREVVMWKRRAPRSSA